MALEDREELLESWLDRWEESQESDATLSPEMLCQDHPELLGELKKRIRELERLDGFLEVARSAVIDIEPSFVEIQAGRYRAKRLHAPGGLGEVFYANDDELNREVALKRLRPSIAWSPEARQRFLFEAEITGRLEHPGVVPVYGLGKDQDGNPYYAMRFIRGETLDQAAEKLHTSQEADLDKRQQQLRSLLQALKSACQTIGYAHAHNVLHRDLKPANIILGDYGEVLVIDWGLAKKLNGSTPASKSDPQPSAPKHPATGANPHDTAGAHLDVTEVGQIKGTPAYMSPEQAEGTAATRASDIYGLGATLYKILSGRSPYSGSTAVAIVEKVLHTPLTPPRFVNPTIPAALNAICVKAMQRDPAERYASALELAQDLGNWLDDVPTIAWPEPFTVRASRWMRNHRTLVVGVAAALGAFLVIAGAFTIRERALNLQLTKALKEVQEQFARAEQEKKAAQFQATRADTNYRQARETVQNMLFRTNAPRWNDVLKIQQLRREQSELVLKFFETISAQPGQDPQVRGDIAWGLIEAGKLQIALGQLEEGKAKLKRAVAATEPLYKAAQDDTRVAMLRSDALLAESAYLESSEALPAIQGGVAVLEVSTKKHPDSLPIRRALIDSLITLGGALINQGDYRQAEKHLVRAVDLSESVLMATPDDTTRLAICARARVNLCAAYRQLKRPAESREQHTRAEQDFERLLKLDPYDRDTVDGLAILRVNGAYDLAAEGKKAEAIEYLQRNVPMLEAVLKQEPDDTAYRDRLYRTHGLAGTFLRQIGKQREAAEAWEKSLAFVSGPDKPLRLVEGIEFWVDAADVPQGMTAARRAIAELPKDSPGPLWTRQSQALERLARLVDGEEKLTKEERKKQAEELRAAAAKARESAAKSVLQDAFQFFRGFSP